MARQKSEKGGKRRQRPATTPEGREKQLISKAEDLAEEQIANGTASSQVITHFLKLGSSRERLEQERMQHEVELTRVKVEAIESQKRVEAMYIEALNAMRSYAGAGDPIPPPEDDVEG